MRREKLKNKRSSKTVDQEIKKADSSAGGKEKSRATKLHRRRKNNIFFDPTKTTTFISFSKP